MIYLDNGATSFHKPPQVRRAVMDALVQEALDFFLGCMEEG